MSAEAVLVTGANGFVGRAVVRRLLQQRQSVHAAVRSGAEPAGMASLRCFRGLDLSPQTDWAAALQGVRAVIHCAARVHMLREASADPLADFRAVNVAGTLRLAEQAARLGVQRFVFVSSIGVHGGQSGDKPFGPNDPPAPHTPYAQSKLEAEQALLALATGTGLEVCIVRPPLVYGPDAPGNFRSLLRAVQRGIPLPFGAVNNLRSLVAVDNLADLLALCTSHPDAAGQVFLVSDGHDMSTTTLLRQVAAAAGRRTLLLPVPPAVLGRLARWAGKGPMAQSLLENLQVDMSSTCERLGWSPPLSVDQALTLALAPEPPAKPISETSPGRAR